MNQELKQSSVTEQPFLLPCPALSCRVHRQVFAAYVLCGAQEKDAVRLTLEQLDVIRRMCTEYTDMELVTTAEGTAPTLQDLHRDT